MDIKVKVGLGLLFAATAAAPAIATAGPPGGVVVPHQHYVQSEGNGLVPVGPNACEDGPSKQFDNFHLNGHLGEPGSRGVIVGRGCPS